MKTNCLRHHLVVCLTGLLLVGTMISNCKVARGDENAAFRDARLGADGALTGRLTDESGRAIPNAQIELYDRDLKRKEARSDVAGRFSFSNVAPGEYLIIIQSWYVPCNVIADTMAHHEAEPILALTLPEHARDTGSENITAAGQAAVFVELPIQTASYSDPFGESSNLFPDSDPRIAYWPDDQSPSPESDPVFTPVQPRADPGDLPEEGMTADDESAAEEDESDEPRFDPALVSRGQAAFQRSCTDCHEANRALDKRKSYSAWLTTVRRMAVMDGANVEPGDHTAIATYLASLNPAGDGTADSGAGLLDEALGLDAQGGFSANATVSLLWRTIDDGNTVLSPGFFPDVWLNASWNPDGPMRAKVVACTSCHSDGGFTFELVEASATVDLMQLYDEIHGRPCDDACEPERACELELRAGRFPMPFGGFTGHGHPGTLRTLTNPLIYDMARRVDNFALPVMNMPFSDEGADLFLKIPIGQEWDVTTDVYAMNGRRETGFASQILSRSYRDNNKEPAVGSRLTIGNGDLRLGSSIVWGDAGVGIEYVAYGGDLNYTFEDLFRIYLEYAYRTQDTGGPINQMSKGYVAEFELYLIDDPGISLLTRYDTLDSNFVFDWEVRRFTWGINTALPGGSMLLVHHEHWDNNLSNGQPDLIGLRWTCAF